MLIRLPHSPVCISDYLFPGETPYDSVDSVLEILGFRPKIEYMDDEIEMVAAPRPHARVSVDCMTTDEFPILITVDCTKL
jgi:hypothetical protein